MQTERQIAKYNCRLAIYTRDVASFTKWLVYPTIGLGAIGVLQGFFLWKSVGLATRAADEAGAIMAAQTSADAANAHARAADEANHQSRFPCNQSATLGFRKFSTRNNDLSHFDENGASVTLRFTLKNVGRAPALYVWPHI